MPKKILNLYAGLGGNRALWPDDEVIVTAVEFDPAIAFFYSDRFPRDTVVIGDAHQYLLEHIRDGWDFIWSSPPCQSHSRINNCFTSNRALHYPEIGQLYGEILLLQHRAPKETKFIVENVKPYYKPLVPPTATLHRHYAWANFEVPHLRGGGYGIDVRWSTTKELEDILGITRPAFTKDWGYKKWHQCLRNCVHPDIGRAVYDAAFANERNQE